MPYVKQIVAGLRSGSGHLVEALANVLQKALDEHETAHLLGRHIELGLLINGLLTDLQSVSAGLRHRVVQLLQFGHPARLVQGFAPLHLLHQEIGGHRSVVVGAHRHPTQLTQIGAASQRILQAERSSGRSESPTRTISRSYGVSLRTKWVTPRSA